MTRNTALIAFLLCTIDVVFAKEERPVSNLSTLLDSATTTDVPEASTATPNLTTAQIPASSSSTESPTSKTQPVDWVEYEETFSEVLDGCKYLDFHSKIGLDGCKNKCLTSEKGCNSVNWSQSQNVCVLWKCACQLPKPTDTAVGLKGYRLARCPATTTDVPEASTATPNLTTAQIPASSSSTESPTSTTQPVACDETYSDSRAINYVGCQDKTKSGRTCQRWDAKFPHEHIYISKAHNFCRSHYNDEPIWCFTTDPEMRFENCNLPFVNVTTISTARLSDSGLKSGSIFVADTDLHRILAFSPEGEVHLVAGGTKGYQDGDIKSAQFKSPRKVVEAPNGKIYVADTDNHVIRSISLEGNVTTLAGSAGKQGFLDGEGERALFYYPTGIAIRNNILYVADSYNHRIRKVDVRTGAVTTVAGTGSGDYKNGLADEAMFYYPHGIAVDSDGILYVADAKNYCVRAISADGQRVYTVAGTGDKGFQDGNALSEARFSYPLDVLVDAHNNIYVADDGVTYEYAHNNIYIRVFSPDGVVHTYAGSGAQGYAGGLGESAELNIPYKLYKSPRGMYVYNLAGDAHNCFQELVLNHNPVDAQDRVNAAQKTVDDLSEEGKLVELESARADLLKALDFWGSAAQKTVDDLSWDIYQLVCPLSMTNYEECEGEENAENAEKLAVLREKVDNARKHNLEAYYARKKFEAEELVQI